MADIHWGASHRVIISCAADRLTIAVLPVLAALTFGYSTYLSVETENDPVGGAFSLAVYSVFLLSTVSIIYAQSLRDEWSRERRKIGLCVVISLYCIIGMPFARVSAALPQNVKAKDYHRCTTTFEELDKSGEYSNAEFDYSEALASQVRQLAMDICQLASARQINVVNGDSGQMGNVASFLVPAAALGALGYGYMKWKATERHLTQMIGNLDGKLVELNGSNH